MKAEAKWVVESWAQELQSVLQFLTGEDWSSAVSVSQSGSAPVGYFWWTQAFNLAPGAEISIGAPALAWSELGARVLQSAGVDLIEQASAKSTYLEAVQQSTSGLARVFSDRVSRVIDATGGRDEAPSEAGRLFDVVLTTGGFDLPSIRVVVNDQMAAGFQEPTKTLLAASTETAVVATSASAAVAPVTPASVSVLLDVQMPVSICFGRASMPLREVMKLTTGSAVELDRRPDEEVDIIVNNCVIARGEVVVIDGNYGVRVTGIISREQRMALRAGVRI